MILGRGSKVCDVVSLFVFVVFGLICAIFGKTEVGLYLFQPSHEALRFFLAAALGYVLMRVAVLLVLLALRAFFWMAAKFLIMILGLFGVYRKNGKWYGPYV